MTAVSIPGANCDREWRSNNPRHPAEIHRAEDMMRSPKIGLLILAVISFSAIPLRAEALQIVFCVPNCTSLTNTHLVAEDPELEAVADANGVYNTTLSLAGVTVATEPNATTVFTVTGSAPKVVAQQSSTLQKITFSTMRITAPASGCSTTTPCQLEIVATSHPSDFPAPKPTGGYPAGAFLNGYFLGPSNTYPAVGDWVSMTAEAAGVGGTVESPTLTVLNKDVVNATPGGSSADSHTSLPRACTGSPTCKFTVTSTTRSIYTSIDETVQHTCETADPCRTRLKTTLNLNFVRSGDSFTLPAGLVTVDPPDPGQPNQPNPVALLIGDTFSPFGRLDVKNLAVGANDFALNAMIELAAGTSIDPLTEEVYLRVGSGANAFTLAVPEGSFQRRGQRFVFAGRVAGVDVAAAFERDAKNPALWKFGAGVHGVHLTVPQPPHQTPVEIGVGGDKGSDLVTPTFF